MWHMWYNGRSLFLWEHYATLHILMFYEPCSNIISTNDFNDVLVFLFNCLLSLSLVWLTSYFVNNNTYLYFHVLLTTIYIFISKWIQYHNKELQLSILYIGAIVTVRLLREGVCLRNICWCIYCIVVYFYSSFKMEHVEHTSYLMNGKFCSKKGWVCDSKDVPIEYIGQFYLIDAWVPWVTWCTFQELEPFCKQVGWYKERRDRQGIF